ncbi:hypothetical protein V5799_024965 [Amblyomma americanum]|uniref:Secreted protein n=1 Tax=Amblyomma americanum TaxID=6943 RepID=A0AAQ4EAI6_AMBAM
MRFLALLAVVTACYTNAAVSTEDNEHGLDAFKIWTAFPNGTAITASDQSNLFECAEATRTRIDPDTKSVTYDFYFPSNGESTTFHLKADDSPGSVTFTVGSDPTPYKAVFYYSDYKTCAVEHFDLSGGGKRNTVTNCI